MKISVTHIYTRPACKTIVTSLLLAGLIGCSSTAEKEQSAYVEPETRSGTIVATEPEIPESRKQAVAESVKVAHPRTYTVQKGDTLWDIANLFLKDPWFWPEIWHQNPQVANPHLIYPGDVLTLIYVDGMPRIVVSKPGDKVVVTDTSGALPVKKLSPSIRSESIDASIDTIPGDAIRQFLSKPRVVTKEEAEAAPYIVGSPDEHLILGEDNEIYIRGELDKERVRYAVLRKGVKLVDPDSKEVLGYEGIYAGEALVHTYGDPAVGKLTFTEREVLRGDRLLPTDKSKIDNLYFPRLPEQDISGKIIHLPDALFGVAKLQVAVINRGSRDGVDTGHLLATYSTGKDFKDMFDPDDKNDNIVLPDIRSGLMMIFKTFDHVSYGLILESTRVIHNHDLVRTPK